MPSSLKVLLAVAVVFAAAPVAAAEPPLSLAETLRIAVGRSVSG